MKTPTLNALLANTYALYLKTQNYHWNVRGIHFQSLHALFEEQYIELARAVDEIAEHIRMQGEFAPGSFNAYQKLNKVPDANVALDAKTMIADLLSSQKILLDMLHTALMQFQQENDEITISLIMNRIGAHRKYQWILSSLSR